MLYHSLSHVNSSAAVQVAIALLVFNYNNTLLHNEKHRYICYALPNSLLATTMDPINGLFLLNGSLLLQQDHYRRSFFGILIVISLVLSIIPWWLVAANDNTTTLSSLTSFIGGITVTEFSCENDDRVSHGEEEQGISITLMMTSSPPDSNSNQSLVSVTGKDDKSQDPLMASPSSAWIRNDNAPPFIENYDYEDDIAKETLSLSPQLFSVKQHGTFERDGFLVVSDLLGRDVLDEVVTASHDFVAHHKKKHMKSYFSLIEMGMIFQAGSRNTSRPLTSNEDTTTHTVLNQTITKAFRKVALESILPRAAAELMRLTDQEQVRVLRYVSYQTGRLSSLTIILAHQCTCVDGFPSHAIIFFVFYRR
jgi:hypothetical protein